MKDAAAAECRCIGIHGAKDYSCETLARIILKEDPETEDEATNLICSWYVGKIVYDDEYAERKARTTERTKGERGRAAKPHKQSNSLAKQHKHRSGHILRARTVPDGNSYRIVKIIYRV